jgi:Heparinase II/III-like protein
MSSGMIAACFSPERLAARLPRPGSWRPYPAVRDRAAWDAVHPATREHLLGQAARMLASAWPVLTATGYARFFTDGDRQAYERPYFTRRDRLGAAVLTAALSGPSPSRVGDIIDGVWLLCEETSWCLPAHHLFARRSSSPLPDPAEPCVDLFAAETAGLLAYTDLLAGDLIEQAAPVARRRLHEEVKTRVLDPYRNSDEWWWFGLRKENLNNWTPWIHSNLLPASLLLDGRPQDIGLTCQRTVEALDRYLDAVPDDGGCDEGTSYWWRAGGSLFECLATLASACGDDYGVFEIQKIRAIARYPVIAHIADEWHVNFADGSARPRATSPHVLYRYGQAIGDQQVAQQARALRGDRAAAADLVAGAGGSIARPLSAMFDASWCDAPPCPFPMPAQAWLSGTGVLTARSQAGTAAGLFLAAKAGHNAESHNHNDIGSFIAALDGRPLLIDVGVGVYTRRTFGPDRYEIWTMQSSWHNVPEVDGVAQTPGREYAARRVQGLLAADSAELSMDLAGAYQPEAGIRSWRRTIRLSRDGTGDGKIIIDDAWDLDHSPERIVVYLIAAGEPRPVAPGRLVIAAAGGSRNLAVDYPHPDFDARTEERRIDDRQLTATWGPAVYRITLAARQPAARGAAHLEISAA